MTAPDNRAPAPDWADPAVIHTLLADTTTWFVVGLGDNPARAAYGVAQVLLAHGKQVVPIHPGAATVLGQWGFPDIASAAAELGPPDVVDIFLRPELVGPVVDQAIEAGAGAVWLQLGVIDEAAAQRAHDAGLAVVMDRCPAIEWRR